MSNPKEECFVIMPISESDEYESDHFRHVYEDVISVACDIAGFKPVRADDVNETNLIHVDVLKRLIDSPMAVCDLSSCNPNVLFELGLRQAFDKPVVLIQEEGTPPIFDISLLRYTKYRKTRLYHQVLEDQENIAKAIKATKIAAEKGTRVNSMINLMSLSTPAQLREFHPDDSNPMMQVIMAELDSLKQEIRSAVAVIGSERNSDDDVFQVEMERINLMHNRAEKMIFNDQGGVESLKLGLDLSQRCSSKCAEMLEIKERTGISRMEYDYLTGLISRSSSLRAHAERLLELHGKEVMSDAIQRF